MPLSSHNFKFSSAIARKSESEALPNTSMARSNILNLKPITNTLRNTTPAPSAHTNFGNTPT